MKIKQLIKLLVLIVVGLFISLYFTAIGGYYENSMRNKNILTKEAMIRFEQDIKEGKPIIASNYIQEEKDYTNNISKTTMKISNYISKSFDKIMKFIFKQLEKSVNN